MKRNKILAFFMAFMLLAQPAAAMAAESGTSSTTQEQTETEPAPDTESLERKESETSGSLTGNPSGKKSEEESPPEDGEDPKEGTAEQETSEAETEGTETEKTEIEETVAASENETAEAEAEENRIILELPLWENYGSSPFDFIMDPQGLITETNAAKYDGASFEEGATLYFKNTDGDYEYSHISDRLGIVSRSSVPVLVTVELAVEDTDGVELVQSADFSDDGSCSLYLALLDSDGNETAVDAEGKAVFQTVLPACIKEDETAVCSFALTGCCNPDGDWSGMEKCPRITVNWLVEPMVSEEEKLGSKLPEVYFLILISGSIASTACDMQGV